ncbi:hypothetical protein ACHAXN_000307, partial [Cyclotella atomus]
MESEQDKEKMEELVTFMLFEFGAALRSEEVPLVLLKGMLTFWQESTQAKCPHVMLTLKGRFKGETGHRWHCVPNAAESRSGLPVKLWAARLLHRRVSLQNKTTGPLFRSGNGKLQTIATLDHYLIELIDEVWTSHPSVVSKETLTSDYSLWRSGRHRGATTEAMNSKIDATTMELIARWRKREGARG